MGAHPPPGHPSHNLIASKLRPPTVPSGVIARDRISARLDTPTRVALVVAPPGYGKTMAVRQWIDATERPTSWLSLDLLDDSPLTFWTHVIRAIRTVLPDVDGEAQAALSEDARRDFFLGVLIAQIERSAHEGTVVLDDLARLTNRRILDGVALLVERVGDRLRLAITARSDPAMPVARWRAAGWLTDVREEHLRLDDAEALAIAATFADLDIASETIVALNRRVEGWPLGFHLALVSTYDRSDGEAGVLAFARSDRLLADYMVAEVLDRLPPGHRDVALVLSIVDWFDVEVCRRLAGPDAGPVVADLERRRLFLSAIPDRPGTMRFHPLFRDLLQGELRWRDPMRHAELHRRAAAMWHERGELSAARRHLVAVGDVAAANDLVLQPALRLIDRGDRQGVATMLRSLPPDIDVDDPALAFDLSVAWFFAGSGPEAEKWCERAESLMSGNEVTDVELRRHSTRCLLALMSGDLERADAHVAAFERFAHLADLAGPMERRFPTLAARVALGSGRIDDARAWLHRARAIEGPVAVVSVTVPALEAWLDVLSGRLRPAIARVETLCEMVENDGMRPHHGAFEALVTAAWTWLGAGDLSRADEYAGSARVDAELLGFDWHRLRAGALAAHVSLLKDGPSAALAIVGDTRLALEHLVSPTLLALLDVVEARSLLRMGRVEEARARLEASADTPRAQLVRAEIALASGRSAMFDESLADASSWSLPRRLEAAVLSAAADRTGLMTLTAAVEEGARTGWVSPFLGHSTKADDLLRREPLERLHPRLAEHLRPVAPSAPTSAVEALTVREMTILELLPTHLSYAQIGEHLFLSVNTVKSNMKSVYRKLGVTTRSEAVDAAHSIELI